MSLRDTDTILVAPEAVAYVEQRELAEGAPLAKCEVIEHFFDWLKKQDGVYQIKFLRKALRD